MDKLTKIVWSIVALEIAFFAGYGIGTRLSSLEKKSSQKPESILLNGPKEVRVLIPNEGFPLQGATVIDKYGKSTIMKFDSETSDQYGTTKVYTKFEDYKK